jgi:putative ABC transport system permease protein
MPELRLAIRSLLKARAFSLITIAVVALGIGATTAVFTIVNGVLLQPLDLDQPQQLYIVREGLSAAQRLGYPWVPANPIHYQRWRAGAHAFSDMAISAEVPATVTGGAREPEMVRMANVSAGLFSLLGVTPLLGRRFTANDDRTGQSSVAILSHAIWERRFGGNPQVVGRPILVNGAPLTIVGVLPASFRWPVTKGALFGSRSALTGDPDLYRPLALDTSKVPLMSDFNFDVLARLTPGVAPAQALAQLNAIEQNIVRESKAPMQMWAVLQPLQDTMTETVHTGLLLLLGAILAVLLIACINLANLALARATGRTRETAVRAALGAGRGRLLWGVLAEHLVLAVVGGVLGILLAVGGVRALLAAAPAGLPRAAGVHIDGTVITVAVLLTMVSGIFFGVFPAWKLSRTSPQDSLQAGGRSSSDGPRARRLGNTLIGIEAAVSVVLLMLAALLATSFVRLLRMPTGFSADHVLTADVRLPDTAYPTPAAINRFFDEALAKLRTLPGVEQASTVSALPVTGNSWFDVVSQPGDPRPMAQRPMAQYRFVSPGYFATLGIPIKRGRDFTAADQGGDGALAIVSERAAEQLWPDHSPLDQVFSRNDGKPLRIIGVAGNVPAELDKASDPVVYLPYWLEPRRVATLAIRTGTSPASMASTVKQAIWSLNADIPAPQFTTMTEVVDVSVAERRFEMWLTLLFAGVALALAALGLYGVISYWVTRRSGELGIRLALGAQPSSVARLVLREGLRPVAIGAVAGLVSAFWAGRVIASLLFHVRPDDPTTILLVVAALAVVATLACLLPAWRAARIDPTLTLRGE